MDAVVLSKAMLKEGSQSRRRLLFVVNDAAFFVSHRLPIAAAAIEAGYEVHVATSPGEGVSKILQTGVSTMT